MHNPIPILGISYGIAPDYPSAMAQQNADIPAPPRTPDIARKTSETALHTLAERCRDEPLSATHWTALGIVREAAGLDPARARLRAVLLEPQDAGNLNDLGAADPSGMKAALRLLVLDPLHGPATIMSALHAFGQERYIDAQRLLARLRLSDPANIEATFLLASSLEQEPPQAMAARLYRTSLVLAPEDPLGAGRALARLGAGPAEAAFPPAHVRMVFDGYAESFDMHLTGRLKYTAPETLLKLAHASGIASSGSPVRTAIDIGCGTGLTGAVFRPHCRHLTGIDISGEMIRRADAKAIYDRLVTLEAVAFLRNDPALYELAIAADVTSYIPDLPGFLSVISARLEEGGTLLLTALEPPAGTAPGLGPDGAYTHSLTGLEEAAFNAGLRVLKVERGAMREEAGQPLATLFLAFTKLRQTGV